MPKAETRKWIVTNPDHPLHEEFVRVLDDRETNDPMADVGSVRESRRTHLQPS